MFPFIYLLIEPNVIFVYRIETKKYITLSDFREWSDFEVFGINHPDDFETFNHKKMKQIKGNAFCLSQDIMNKIVEEINEHIQKVEHLKGRMDEVGAVHIITSESAAGSLRVGLEKPNTVIGFPDSFAIGPLWKLDEEIGRDFRKQWLYENINDEQDDYAYENKLNNTLREIRDIGDNVPIYIWYGNNANEQTGLRFYLYLLREKANKIFLMNVTGEIDSEKFRGFFINNKDQNPLCDNIRSRFYGEWEQLAQSKEVLRIWRKNEIKGVLESYYDDYILKTIEKLHQQQDTKDFVNVGDVIGELLVMMDTYIDVFFLEYRIRHLIYSGALALKGIPKSMRHYSVKL